MPAFTFTSPDGKNYTVNGPDGASKEQAFAVLQSQMGQPPAPNPIVDALHVIPGGLAKGVSNVVGFPGTISDLISSGLDAGLNSLTGANVHTAQSPFSSTSIQNAIGNSVGGFYAPQTTLGRYAETAASFAPYALGGEASLAERALGRVLVPAAGAQIAGSAVDATAHPTLHAVAETVGALGGSGLSSGASKLAEALATDPAPELTAEKYLGRIADQNGTTPESILANAIPNRGQLGAEAMGPQGVAMMATLGRRGGTTADSLANALTTRAAAAPQRIMDDYATAAGIHPEAAQGNIDALVDSGRASAGDLYDQVLNKPGGVMTPALADLAQRPIIQKGLAQAAIDLRNDGKDPSAYGLFFDDAGNATQVSHPTAEAWDLAKKAVGQSVDRDAFGNRLPDSKSPGNVNISNANRSLSTAMSDAIPGYGDALAQSGDYLSLKSAFDAGQSHILDTGTTAAQVANYVADMSPAELDAYKGGIANQIFSKAQNARLAPRILNTPAVQQKLVAALGEDNANQFLSGVNSEIQLARTGGRMMPGAASITSDAMLAAGDQDQAANLAAALQGARAVGSLARGDVGGAAMSGISAIRHFAPDFLKSGGMSAEVRNNLGTLLSLPPEELAQRLARIQQSPQSAISRALQR